jgi:peptidoglycan lytic transglycosylase
MQRAPGSGKRWIGLGYGVLLGALVALAGCSSTSPGAGPGPHFKVGAPYQVDGKWYYPKFVDNYEATGIASWYGTSYDGHETANGEIYDVDALTAAHPTLQLPSLVRVTNLENGRSLVLRVNDRGPFLKGRVIDLSQAAARELGFEDQGLARVHVQYLGLARLDEKPIRPGEQRAYAAATCALPKPEHLVC